MKALFSLTAAAVLASGLAASATTLDKQDLHVLHAPTMLVPVYLPEPRPLPFPFPMPLPRPIPMPDPCLSCPPIPLDERPVILAPVLR